MLPRRHLKPRLLPFQRDHLNKQTSEELKTLIADLIALHPAQRPVNWRMVIAFCEQRIKDMP
jgi:hypothetical protein